MATSGGGKKKGTIKKSFGSGAQTTNGTTNIETTSNPTVCVWKKIPDGK